MLLAAAQIQGTYIHATAIPQYKHLDKKRRYFFTRNTRFVTRNIYTFGRRNLFDYKYNQLTSRFSSWQAA